MLHKEGDIILKHLERFLRLPSPHVRQNISIFCQSDEILLIHLVSHEIDSSFCLERFCQGYDHMARGQFLEIIIHSASVYSLRIIVLHDPYRIDAHAFGRIDSKPPYWVVRTKDVPWTGRNRDRSPWPFHRHQKRGMGRNDELAVGMNGLSLFDMFFQFGCQLLLELFLGQNPVGIDVFVTLPKNKRI